jgi:hypothetical protein
MSGEDTGGPVYIHRTEPRGEFTQLPNALLRDQRLSYPARGYLAEMLSNKPSWRPETARRAADRAQRARGEAAESRRQFRRSRAELERYGYLHRVVRSAGRGQVSTEFHYYDEPPAGPCKDAEHCVTCRHRAATVIDPPELTTRNDQGQHGVSAGRFESSVFEGSISDASLKTQEDPKHDEDPKHHSPGAQAPGEGVVVPDQRPPAGAAAGTGYSQGPLQKTTEQIITAKLATSQGIMVNHAPPLIGSDISGEQVRYLQRTLRLNKPHRTRDYTAYAARCLFAARGLLAELLDAREMSPHDFPDEAGPLLRAIRDAARQQPVPWADDIIDALTASASALAHPGMTAAQAAAAGAALRWSEIVS